MAEIFSKSFTDQAPLPKAALEAALAVLQHGRLHRYAVADGDAGETTRLEEDFAQMTGASYALAVASGGYAMGCALRALDVQPGDKVLSNGFTLAPVPGAIASVNATPIFVETTPELTIDLADLKAKIHTSGARVLLLSHMRGHIGDMDALMDLCTSTDVKVIEDCAHTMGAAWTSVPSGRFGAIGCFSCQTYKHINAGEGGLLITDDAELAAKMILLSGSYMLYERHAARPALDVFETLKLTTPNISGRMDNLRAAILRPQLAHLPAMSAAWNSLYRRLETALKGIPEISVIHRPDKEHFVGSSFQFRLPDWSADEIAAFVSRCHARGVELKWFGASEPHGFTSRYTHWAYAPQQHLPQTDLILSTLLDLRLPLSFTEADCEIIGRIIAQEVATGRRTSPRLRESVATV